MRRENFVMTSIVYNVDEPIRLCDDKMDLSIDLEAMRILSST